jgi:hypothetical protein
MERLPRNHEAVGLQAPCSLAGHRPREPCGYLPLFGYFK